ncbi:response regulator [Paenibacillus crassostreae]|uniref:AraC family transcriptional regulator n=1 Tax=Paenibacillus crassostreae TaxID=1763538 RepID=A0A167BV44_9BACL|nr:response regulator [Paenibacillus crassostreae]AOZ92527.1 DNA-binding response regulator [Paenibacillus crassostreae]OAB72475.1 AraC family transcriptional regulator [Paenibacillus crassostreae]
MKRTLLIVDDEKNIRLGLKTMIEREYPEIYDIQLAGNGQIAIEQYRKTPADIVITDIRMPVMDGIRLLEELTLAAKGEEPVIIILSGYDDFEYAKTAIKYKVKDYLLKPIRREELFGQLERINKELTDQELLVQRRAEESDLFRKIHRSNIIQQLLMEKEPLSELQLEKYSLEIGFEKFIKPFTVAVVNFQYEDGSRMNTNELQSLVERLSSTLGNRVEVITSDIEGRLVLIGSPKNGFQQLSKLAEVKGWHGLRMGLSSEQYQLVDITTQYHEAVRALQYTFLYPQANYIDYEVVKEERQNFQLPLENIRRLANMLGTDHERDMMVLLGSIFQTEHLQRIDISYLERVSRLINEQVLDEIFMVYGEASVEVLKLYRKVGNMFNFQTFHDYYRKLEHLLISVNDYVTQVRSAYTENGDMKEAVAFIEEQYARPLNMAMVSNHVSLNYSYFSEAFKAYTGENFVLFLKKVRIRKAKELLVESSVKLSVIGESVGFENSKQFSRVFKELEGVTPHEYRNKVQTVVKLKDGLESI